MERYLAVCSRLAENNFAIIRRYSRARENPPTLATWLGAVVRNMCIDTYRAAHGRHRFPKALLGMSELDRRVFALYYWQGESPEEIQHHIGDSAENIAGIMARIEQSLFRPLIPSVGYDVTLVSFEDSLFNPPSNGDAMDEMVSGVEDLLDVLKTEEQLVVHMRFWEDMSMREIAELLELPSEHHAFSILRSALEKLRHEAVKLLNE